jgi:hypothetical protein
VVVGFREKKGTVNSGAIFHGIRMKEALVRKKRRGQLLLLGRGWARWKTREAESWRVEHVGTTETPRLFCRPAAVSVSGRRTDVMFQRGRVQEVALACK